MAGIMRLIRPQKTVKPPRGESTKLRLPVKVARMGHMIRTVFGLEV